MYLFVCTGNTCRSPMAAALWQKRGHAAESAGIYAMPGSGPSTGAIHAMSHFHIDLTGHRASPVTGDMMAKADKVIALTQRHVYALAVQFPQYRDKIACLPGGDIPDPFGGDDEEYLQCARAIDAALDKL